MNNLSKKPTYGSEAKIRFRCPKCSKLYTSNPAEIFVDKPEFKCTSCESSFYISFNDALKNHEVIGYLLDQKQLEAEKTLSSSRKDTTNAFKTSQSEMADKNFVAKVDWSVFDYDVQFVEENQKNPSLEEAWAFVQTAYTNNLAHKKFIKMARSFNNIEYAKQMYSQILKSNPFDEIARSKFNLINIEEETERMLIKENDKTQLKWSMWSFFTIGFGLLFIFLGLVVFPEFKKLAGLGLGLVVFTFALKSLLLDDRLDY